MDRPLTVSILIPAFNAEKWIAETLQSAVSQTWKFKEVIVVDDGSTDRTGRIARQFPVQVVRQENKGAAAARNSAYAVSRGDYIQWLDADDVLAPDKIERQMEHIAGTDVLLSSSWSKFKFRRALAESKPTALWTDLTPEEWLFRKIAFNLWMPPCSWLVSRELTEAAGPWDPTMYVDDDGEYFCRVLMKSSTVRFIPEAMSYYRDTGFSSLSHIGRSQRKMEAQWRSLEVHVGDLLSFGDTEERRRACVGFLRSHVPVFIPDRLDLVDRANELAKELGGKLEIPRLPWKYRWIRIVFGWNVARAAQLYFPKTRWIAAGLWDRLLHRIQKEEGFRNTASNGDSYSRAITSSEREDNRVSAKSQQLSDVASKTPTSPSLPQSIKPFESNGAFRKPVSNNRLRGVAIRGAGVTLLAQSITYLFQFAGITILARLLVPSDFGLVTLVTTFSIFLVTIAQSGIPEAILQREELNRRLASNAFWIIFGVASTLTLVFALAGPLLAKLYRDPRISSVAEVVSLSIFLTGASVVHVALLDRGMRFSANAANTIVSRVLSVSVSVVLAWTGWGYWALVAGVIVQPLALLIGACFLCRWIPDPPRPTEGTRALFSFALNVNAMGNISYWTRNMDNLLVGWRFGSGPLGFYKKAYDLFVLPTNQMQAAFPVAVSTLSRLKPNPAQYRRYFLAGLSALAMVGMGIGGMLTVTGREVVRIILGPGWGASGWILTLFAPGMGLFMIYKATAVIHLSIGTSGRLLRWTIVELVVIGLMFLVALHWGPMGMAAAWTVSSCILIVPGFVYAGRPIQLGIAQVLSAIWRPAAASGLAGLASALVLRANFLPASASIADAFIRCGAKSVLFFILYAGAIVILHGGWHPLFGLFKLLREMIPSGLLNVQAATAERQIVAVKSPTAT